MRSAASALWRKLLLLISIQEISDALYGVSKDFSFRKHYDSEVIRFMPVESASRYEEDISCVKKITGKFFIACDVKFFYIKFWKDVKCTVIFNK